MARLADEAHVGGEVTRPYEDAVNAGNGCDLPDVAKRLLRFELNDDADPVHRPAGIILHAAIARGAAHAGKAAYTLRGIARRRDGLSRPLPLLDLGEHDRHSAETTRVLAYHR